MKKRKKKRKYVARPGIEPRTPDLRFGFNGPLRQYFSLYRAVSQSEGERGERIDESKKKKKKRQRRKVIDESKT